MQHPIDSLPLLQQLSLTTDSRETIDLQRGIGYPLTVDTNLPLGQQWLDLAQTDLTGLANKPIEPATFSDHSKDTHWHAKDTHRS
jgi:hypothetical protein